MPEGSKPKPSESEPNRELQLAKQKQQHVKVHEDGANVLQKEAKKQQQIIPFNPASTFVDRNAFIQHSHQPVDKNLLKAPLTRENYRRKFHQLLCREEEEHEKILRER